jgi:hypothetical protein
MSDKQTDTLKKALRDAEISDVEMEKVSGGVGGVLTMPMAGSCGESCQEGCSQCCSPGNAER